VEHELLISVSTHTSLTRFPGKHQESKGIRRSFLLRGLICRYRETYLFAPPVTPRVMPSGQPLSKSIKRQSKSCKRCLKRKQRCHGFPVCGGCEEAKQQCEQSEYALQLHKHDSSYAAFERIQTLETQLASALGELRTLRQGQQHPLGGSYSTNEFLLDQQRQASQDQEQQLPILPVLHPSCIPSINATGYTRGGDGTISI